MENIAIENPTKICWHCRKEKDIKVFSYPSLGYGSIFDDFSSEFHICEDCLKSVGKDIFSNKVITEKYGDNDMFSYSVYENEDKLAEFVNSHPVEIQELFYNKFGSSSADYNMESNDWINLENGIITEEMKEKYGL